MEDKVSVLMSVYKKEKPQNLKLAIMSIINQTREVDEIILVEDGPLGEELDSIIKEIKMECEYLKNIKLKKNVGLGRALNEGLKHCKNNFVARMDSDDICELNRIELQLDFMKENPNIDVIGGNIVEFDDLTGENVSYRIVPKKHEDIVSFLKKRNPMNHVTVMFKKNKVIDSGGYLDCLFFEDYYLWARMINNGCIFANLDNTLVRVRAGLSMSGRRGSINYIKSIINFEKKLYNLKMISLSLYIYNVFMRSIVSVIPNKLRYNLYQRRLRINEKN